MAQSRFAKPALGAAVVLGTGFYLTQRRAQRPVTSPPHQRRPQESTKSQSHEQQRQDVEKRREHADAKRDLGLGGAGVGNNAITGGTELGSGLKSGNTESPHRSTATPEDSKAKLPSGGITENGRSNGGSQGLGSTVQRVLGTSTSERTREPIPAESDPKNTKIKSHLPDTPTNRGGSPHDKHRKDVTAVSQTSERPGMEG